MDRCADISIHDPHCPPDVSCVVKKNDTEGSCPTARRELHGGYAERVIGNRAGIERMDADEVDS